MSAEPDERRVIAQAATPRGELVLTRRGAVTELRVNGVYVMDTGQTVSERLLARAALDRLPPDGDLSVLVGGLGLGFTLAEVLTEDRVSRVEVVDIEADLVAWHRAGLVPETAAALNDRRVSVTVGDIAEMIDAAGGEKNEVDLILLDVDNGPGYLVYDGNETLYGRPFLARCRRRCRAAGVVAIWSAQQAPELFHALTDTFADADEVAVPVMLGRRRETYWMYLGFA